MYRKSIIAIVPLLLLFNHHVSGQGIDSPFPFIVPNSVDIVVALEASTVKDEPNRLGLDADTGAAKVVNSGQHTNWILHQNADNTCKLQNLMVGEDKLFEKYNSIMDVDPSSGKLNLVTKASKRPGSNWIVKDEGGGRLSIKCGDDGKFKGKYLCAGIQPSQVALNNDNKQGIWIVHKQQ